MKKIKRVNDESKNNLKRKLTTHDENIFLNAIRDAKDEEAKRIVDMIEHVDEIFPLIDTVLKKACEHGRLELAKYIISLGANLNLSGSGGFTPLMMASNYGRLEVVQMLIDAGADVNIVNTGDSAFSRSCKSGLLEITRILLESEVDMEKCGQNCLFWAVDRGNVELCRLLLDAGAGINDKNQEYYGWTALHKACSKERIELVEFLLNNGIDETITNNEGKTAADIAKSSQIKDLIANYGNSHYVLK